MKKRLICASLAVFLLVGCLFTGCSKPSTENQQSADGQKSDAELLGTVVEGTYLIEDGSTNYVLVLPASALAKETFAAEEFNTMIEMAAGCTLQIVTEYAVPANAKYISIGNTQQLKTAFPEEAFEALKGKQSSYFAGSKDNNIYIAGGTSYQGEGSLYGVYDLLHNLVDYTFYSETEIHVTESRSVQLWNYEPQFIHPSIEMRTHSTQFIYGHDLVNDRFRYINFSKGSTWDHTTNGHSQLMAFVHPSEIGENGVTYGQSHPEWFVDPYEVAPARNSNQLCWTAGGSAESRKELVSVVVSKMLLYLQMNPDSNIFMFGQHDNSNPCTCQGCLDAMQEYGGTYSGLQIDFFNEVVDQVKLWLDAYQPDRDVQFVLYAYLFTQAPPVKQTQEGYEPYSDRVIPHENVYIWYAPVNGNYAFPISSPINQDISTELAGWKSVCDGHIYVYIYDLNCCNYYLGFYNDGTTQSMLQTFVDAGVEYVMDQGVSDTVNVPGFQDLKAYVTANLMWNVNRSYRELAADFIRNYYKDAADSMQEIYDRILDQSAYYATAIDNGMGTIKAYPVVTELYPRAFVQQLDALYQNAFDSIAHYEADNPELYEELNYRIMKDYMTILYLKGVAYPDSYSEEEIANVRDIFKTYTTIFGTRGGGEGAPLPEF